MAYRKCCMDTAEDVKKDYEFKINELEKQRENEACHDEYVRILIDSEAKRIAELEKAMQEVIKDPLFKIHFTVRYYKLKKLLEKG